MVDTQGNIFTKNDDMFFYIYNWGIYNYHCTELKNLILVTKDKITAIITSYIGLALGKQKFHKHTRKNHNENKTIFLSI